MNNNVNRVSEEEPPNNPQDGFIYLLENQEPHGLPQEAHVTTSLH
jgi:hypothetical protein